MESFDLLIIGGGINGAAIARDAAIRGASVLLVEKDDLASHTSSASSKLIHGGLRYLEYYEFRLVGEALREREILLRTAPHIVRPLRFALPHCRGMRPFWIVRAGLLVYDLLSLRGSLPRSRRLWRGEDALRGPLQERRRLPLTSRTRASLVSLSRSFSTSATHGPAALTIAPACTSRPSDSRALQTSPSRRAESNSVRAAISAPRSAASSAFSTTSRASSTQASQ